MKDVLSDAMDIMTLTTFSKVFGDTNTDEFFAEIQSMLYNKYNPEDVNTVIETLVKDIKHCIKHFEEKEE